MRENDYVVEVNFMGESISLSAFTAEEALERAKNIIAEEYGYSVAGDATYKVSA